MNGIKQCMSTEAITFDEDVYVRKERFINGLMFWFIIGDYLLFDKRCNPENIRV